MVFVLFTCVVLRHTSLIDVKSILSSVICDFKQYLLGAMCRTGIFNTFVNYSSRDCLKIIIEIAECFHSFCLLQKNKLVYAFTILSSFKLFIISPLEALLLDVNCTTQQMLLMLKRVCCVKAIQIY